MLEAAWISATRTAAYTVLSARLLAAPGVDRIAVLGCGALAETHLDLLDAELPDDVGGGARPRSRARPGAGPRAGGPRSPTTRAPPSTVPAWSSAPRRPPPATWRWTGWRRAPWSRTSRSTTRCPRWSRAPTWWSSTTGRSSPPTTAACLGRMLREGTLRGAGGDAPGRAHRRRDARRRRRRPAPGGWGYAERHRAQQPVRHGRAGRGPRRRGARRRARPRPGDGAGAVSHRRDLLSS